MTPNEDLVHYIEDELYKGVPIADVLYAVRSAGWRERQIQDAMTFLDRQHEAMLLDSLPIEQKSRFPSFSLPGLSRFSINWKLGGTVMAVTVVSILLIAGFAKLLSRNPKAPTEQLSDPNFTIQLPQGWQVDQSYKPGSRMLFVRSPEDSSPNAAQKMALITMYPDAELDVFGKQLLSQSADVDILRNETTKNGSIRTRYIEFKTRDILNEGHITHGAYVFVDKGLVKMSAMISSRDEFWPTYAAIAEQTLKSFMPSCSRESEHATNNADGTFQICGNQPLPATTNGTVKLPD